MAFYHFPFSDMRKTNGAFSLVELLVVITILAIISIVAYTSFGGATDKAKNSSRLQHIGQIETALQTFNQKNNYYPLPSIYDTTKNMWGYNKDVTAGTGNILEVTKSNDEITGISSALGGGTVSQSGSTGVKIGAKGVMDSSVLSKEYLSAELYDPALKDVKVGTDKTLGKDFGIGKYTYAVYSPKQDWTSTTDGKKGLAYNIATVIVNEDKSETVKITGNFDAKFSGCAGTCPDSLIGPGGSTAALKDNDSGTPYAITPTTR